MVRLGRKVLRVPPVLRVHKAPLVQPDLLVLLVLPVLLDLLDLLELQDLLVLPAHKVPLVRMELTAQQAFLDLEI
jgi:hypothetical protein